MTFQQENDNVLKMILNERFFKQWRNINNDDKSLYNDSTLELYITSACDQHCEYCYLVKYPELYPHEYLSPNLIKSNLQIILNWIMENQFQIPRIDIFSGEIWNSQFGLDILQIILDAIKQGAGISYILIPTNGSFCLTEKQMMKIQHYINEYALYNCRLVFSLSIDGKIADNITRIFNDTTLQKTDDYYERIFLFTAHNHFGFHPMISSANAKCWIENYEWWKQELVKYNLSPRDLMTLEVRNNDWTEETIQAYNAFITYLMEDDYKRCNCDIKTFVLSLFNLIDDNIFMASYLPYMPGEANTYPSCTVGYQLTIRVGDLAIPPCHRTAYNKLLYGKFVLNEQKNKIIDITSNNIYMATKILFGNLMTTNFKCDSCNFRNICLKQCFGEQYEDNADPFMPTEVVCHFYEEKWKAIVSKFYDLKAIDFCKEYFNPFHPHYQEAKDFIDFCEGVNKTYGLGKS